MNCNECGTETANPKFCSRSCAAKHNNKLFPKRKLTRSCLECPKPVEDYRLKHCPAHHKEMKLDRFKSKTIGEYRSSSRRRQEHPTSTHSEIRGFARRWLKHLRELPCAHCGYSKHVELAHIRAVTDFPDEALLSEVNCESNVIQLCPNCHWEFDNLPRELFYPLN